MSQQSTSPSQNRAPSRGSRRWDERYHDQDEMFVAVASPKSTAKMNPNASKFSHSRNQPRKKEDAEVHVMLMSNQRREQPEQLARIKEQWNAQRDIPPGAVRNHTFLPKPEPSPPPSPALVHQKKHWDSIDIPQGSVPSRALENGEEGRDESRAPSQGRRNSPFHSKRSSDMLGGSNPEIRAFPSPNGSSPTSPAHFVAPSQSFRQIVSQWDKGSSSLRPRAVAGRQLHSPTTRSTTTDASDQNRTTRQISPKMFNQKSGLSPHAKVSSPFFQQSITPKAHAVAKNTRKIPKAAAASNTIAVDRLVESRRRGASHFLEEEKDISRDNFDEDLWAIPAKDLPTQDRANTVVPKTEESGEWDDLDSNWLQSSSKRVASSKSVGLFRSLPSEKGFEKAFPNNDAFGVSSREFQAPKPHVDSESLLADDDWDEGVHHQSGDEFCYADADRIDSPKRNETLLVCDKASERKEDVSKEGPTGIFRFFGSSKKSSGSKKQKSRLSFGTRKGTKASPGSNLSSGTPKSRSIDDDPVYRQKDRLEHSEDIRDDQVRYRQGHSVEDHFQSKMHKEDAIDDIESNFGLDKFLKPLETAPRWEEEEKQRLILAKTLHSTTRQPGLSEEREQRQVVDPMDAHTTGQTNGHLDNNWDASDTRGLRLGVDASRGDKARARKYEQEHIGFDPSNLEAAFQHRRSGRREGISRSVEEAMKGDSKFCGPVEGDPTHEHESRKAEASPQVAVGVSSDFDTKASSGFWNEDEEQRQARIQRSGADRKRKTEKLRRYGEVNSRFREPTYQATASQKSNLPHPRSLKSSRYKREVQGASVETKPTSGSRHAKIKCDIAGGKVARRLDLEEDGSKNKRRSKAREYARQRAGFAVNDIINQSASSESEESRTLASVGSDIRVLRAILRRPRTAFTSDVSSIRRKFPTFDTETMDPMQKAGLKMLSATIIPMQAQVRRFLAMRQALTRMWALIIIQAHTRRWIAERRYKRMQQSAVTIQATVRGHLARDDLDFKHVCAIEVQRVIRGYISTMKVYEDIYKITLIQNYVRMKQAMDKVSWKLAHVVQLQSVFRGFLVRRRQEYHQICAIAIQANWRRFYHRLNYQFDLLDVIIAQSVWRKKIAVKKVASIKKARLDKAATVIQSKWRQVRCTAIYIQDLANILVAQSALRRYLGAKRARLIRDYWVIPAQAYARGFLGRKALEKHRAARRIQSAWRGFVSYADYMFSIADIVTVQKVSRAWLAKRGANRARKLNSAATTIQSACRMFLSKALMSRMAEVQLMEKTSREIAEREGSAATAIQAAVRRMQTQSAYAAFLAARRIQTFWRCRNLSKAYKYYRAAMKIQSNFRGMKSRQETMILRGEILAATIIQSAWRGFISYTDYIFTISDIITVQRVFRGHVARKTPEGDSVRLALKARRKMVAAATAIQKACRGLLDRQRYWYTLGCTMQVQSWMRGRLVVLRLRREDKARVKLQSFARRLLARQELVQRKFIFMLIRTAEQERSKRIMALTIQEKAQNDMDDKMRHNAASIIQRFFLTVRKEVDQMVRAAKRRQTWREKRTRKAKEEQGVDDVLEDAWLDAARGSDLENISFLAQNIADAVPKDGLASCNNTRNQDENVPSKRETATEKNFMMPSTLTTRSAAEFSKLTGSEMTFYRLPPARMRRMDSREMSDDLELEEAFMDTKICNAKNRRIIAYKKRMNRV